jgi:hypothetical protein
VTGHALAGFVAGAAVAALAAALLLRSPGGASPAAPDSPSKAETPPRAPDDEAANLRNEVSSLEKRIQAQKAELELLRAGPGGPSSRRAIALRAALAKRVGARALAISESDYLSSSEGRGLQFDLQRWLAALCEESGLTLAEATWSPDGLYAYIAEVIAALDPPLPEQALKDFEAARERVRKEWDAYMQDREGMSILRRGLETAEFVNLLYDAIFETVPDERTGEVCCAFENFELAWGDISNYSFAGSRAEIRANLLDNWSSEFDLRPEQKTALAPIVDEYMRRYEALESQTPTGSTRGYEADRELRRTAIALQEEMQRRVAAELDLSPEQAGRLQQWSSSYGIQVIR